MGFCAVSPGQSAESWASRASWRSTPVRHTKADVPSLWRELVLRRLNEWVAGRAARCVGPLVRDRLDDPVAVGDLGLVLVAGVAR